MLLITMTVVNNIIVAQVDIAAEWAARGGVLRGGGGCSCCCCIDDGG